MMGRKRGEGGGGRKEESCKGGGGEEEEGGEGGEAKSEERAGQVPRAQCQQVVQIFRQICKKLKRSRSTFLISPGVKYCGGTQRMTRGNRSIYTRGIATRYCATSVHYHQYQHHHHRREHHQCTHTCSTIAR